MEEISPKDDILIKLKSSFSTIPQFPSSPHLLLPLSFTMAMNECHKQTNFIHDYEKYFNCYI